MPLTQTTLIQSTVRAAGVRRSWSARMVHWAVEARSHRIICLVLGIWLLNGFDLVFTVLSHEQGMLQEANPLAKHMLQGGTSPIILFKIGLVLIGSYPLLRFRTARITELAALLIFSAYVLLAIQWSRCYEMYSDTVNHAGSFAQIENAVPPPSN